MISPELIIAFPAIFEPRENKQGVEKYSGMFLIDKSRAEDIALINAEYERAKKEGMKKKWNNRLPKFKYISVKDGDEYLENYAEDNMGEEPDAAMIKMYTNRIFFNASCNTKNPPGIVGPDGRLLTDKTAIYSGCIVRIDVRAWPNDFEKNYGVSWWLNNVMLVRGGERLDGKLDAVEAFASYAQPTYENDTHETVDSSDLA